jgi:hypothetical protein
MNRVTLSVTSLATAAALFASGCANMTPGENAAVFGSLGAVTAGTLARASGMSTGESLLVGAAAGAIVAATVYVIAKHQATERQRRIAEARARAAYSRIKVRRQREVASSGTSEPTPKKHHRTSSSGGSSTSASDSPEPAPKQKAAAPKKQARYIAVDTEKDEHTAPQAKKSVMIFDTQTQEIVGNNVYDVQSTPPVGGTAKFDTYTAEYVGSGS